MHLFCVWRICRFTFLMTCLKNLWSFFNISFFLFSSKHSLAINLNILNGYTSSRKWDGCRNKQQYYNLNYVIFELGFLMLFLFITKLTMMTIILEYKLQISIFNFRWIFEWLLLWLLKLRFRIFERNNMTKLARCNVMIHFWLLIIDFFTKSSTENNSREQIKISLFMLYERRNIIKKYKLNTH